MPAILEPDVATATKKRRFTGKLMEKVRHYRGDAPPPKPTLGEMMAKLPPEARPLPPPALMAQSPGDIAVGEGFGKLGLEKRAADEAAKGGQLLSNAEDAGELNQTPKMPPKPGARPGGATSEPLPQDRPAAKSGPTPQQARLQAEMDAAAEQITGREAAALSNQRTLVSMRASQNLNAPIGSPTNPAVISATPEASTDLLRSVGQADATAESAAGTTSRIRNILSGVTKPVTTAAEGVGGILNKVPGVARTGRIVSRLAGSPAARFVGKWGYPIGEGLGAVTDIWRGRVEDTEEIDPDTGERVIDANTGRTQQVSKGIFEPTEEEMQYAAKGGNNLLGVPLFEKREASIPFTENDEGVTKKLPWAGGLIPEVAGEVAQAGAFGPIAGAALMGRKVLRAAGAGGRAWAEASNAEKMKKASEKKYGTGLDPKSIATATDTRHKMEAERTKTDAAKARKDFLNQMQSKYHIDFEEQ